MRPLGIFMGFVAISAAVVMLAPRKETATAGQATSSTPNTQATETAATKAEAERLEKEEQAKQDAWKKEKIAALTFIVAVKRSMKNPDSFKLEQTLLMNDRAICITYRATNSFNAVVPGHAVKSAAGQMGTTGQSGFEGLWSKSCANKSGQTLRFLPQELSAIESLMKR